MTTIFLYIFMEKESMVSVCSCSDGNKSCMCSDGERPMLCV